MAPGSSEPRIRFTVANPNVTATGVRASLVGGDSPSSDMCSTARAPRTPRRCRRCLDLGPIPCAPFHHRFFARKFPIMTSARSTRLSGRPLFEKASNRTCRSRSATGRPAARARPYPGEAIARFSPFVGAAQGRPGPLSLRAMVISASRTRSPNRGILPDRVGLHRERDDTPYPMYGMPAGPEKPFGR